MKLKTLAVTVVLLAALSTAAYLLTRPKPVVSTDPRVGHPIVDRATIDKTAEIHVSNFSEGSAILTKQPDGTWRVSNYYDFHIDFGKLADFIEDTAQAKVVRFVTADPDLMSRLDFTEAKVEFLDNTGKVIWSVILGKSSEAGDGRFIRFGDEQKAYLIDHSPWIDTQPKDWADPVLLHLKPADIARLEVGFADAPAVVISRTNKNDPFTATPTPFGQQLDNGKVAALLKQFCGLLFEDTADPQAQAAKQHARSLKLTTFDRKTYIILLGRNEPKVTTPAPTKKTDDEPVYAFVTCSDASDPVNALMQKRSYQVNAYNYTILPQKPSELFTAISLTPAKP